MFNTPKEEKLSFSGIYNPDLFDFKSFEGNLISK